MAYPALIVTLSLLLGVPTKKCDGVLVEYGSQLWRWHVSYGSLTATLYISSPPPSFALGVDKEINKMTAKYTIKF